MPAPTHSYVNVTGKYCSLQYQRADCACGPCLHRGADGPAASDRLWHCVRTALHQHQTVPNTHVNSAAQTGAGVLEFTVAAGDEGWTPAAGLQMFCADNVTDAIQVMS